MVENTKNGVAGDASSRSNKLTIIVVSFQIAAFVMRRFRNLIMLFVLLFFATSWFSKFNDVVNYPYLVKLIEFDQEINKYFLDHMRKLVPTSFEGRAMADWILVLSAGIFLFIVFGIIERMFMENAIRFHEQRLKLRSRNHPKGTVEIDKMKRKEILEIYAHAKKSLEGHKKHLAFVSIDVVDSTGIKMGEDPVMAELDFSQYKTFAINILNKHHVLKSTWTPDGVMACFETVGDAVRAAQEIVLGLREFNLKIKAIKRDFQVRIGINAGEVYADDATPMEEMTDRVIDIAGHMQKYGCIDGVSISKHAIEPFLSEFHFEDASRTVDDCPAFEWKPS